MMRKPGYSPTKATKAKIAKTLESALPAKPGKKRGAATSVPDAVIRRAIKALRK